MAGRYCAGRWAGILAFALIMPISGCDRPDTAENTDIVVLPSDENRADEGATSVPFVSVDNQSAPLPAVPATPPPIAESASPERRARKTFVDPPLPAELLDDGGLKPLPPRPKPR